MIKETEISNHYRINNRIRASQVRLIGSDGKQVGIVSLPEALRLADSEGLDLVEISPTTVPPVCKIIDWGKFKYEQEKILQAQKKKQRNTEIKGVRLSSKIDQHDFETKLKRAQKFISEGNKVKLQLIFKGREITHKEIGEKVLRKFAEGLEEIAKVEQEPSFAGREMNMVLAPK